VRDQPAVAEEGQQLGGNGGKQRLSRQVCRGKAVHPAGFGRNVALRVDQCVEMLARRQLIDQLQSGDFDDPVAVQRIESGCLGIE